MDLVYYDDEMPDTLTKSIFLAGPSLRPGQDDLESWRKDAIQILEDKGFDGTVFIPEFRNRKPKGQFVWADAVAWEDKYLNLSDCILFWVPRSKDLPGFTTNIEWGRWESSGKVVLGFPENAEKMSYMKHYADKYNVEVGESLTETIDHALDMLGEGMERLGGERYVPLIAWKLPAFQNWYKAQTDTGNQLTSAKLLYTFRPGYKKFTFLWVLHVAVYVAAEDRVKSNEFVLSRTDISTVMLWKKNLPLETSEVVLIKEFRSPASTKDGFIRELPGGSPPSEDEPKVVASEEIHEETGFYLDPARLQFHEARQLMGTLSAHKSYFYSANLTEAEINWFKSQKNVVHGKEEDSERTFIEVYTIHDLIIGKAEVDWSTLGQILLAYYQMQKNLNNDEGCQCGSLKNEQMCYNCFYGSDRD